MTILAVAARFAFPAVLAVVSVYTILAVNTILAVLAVLAIPAVTTDSLDPVAVTVEQPLAVQGPVPAAVFVLLYADDGYSSVRAVAAVDTIAAVTAVRAIPAVFAVLAVIDRHGAPFRELKRVAYYLAAFHDLCHRRDVVILLQGVQNGLQRRDVGVQLRTGLIERGQPALLVRQQSTDIGIVVTSGNTGQRAGHDSPHGDPIDADTEFHQFVFFFSLNA